MFINDDGMQLISEKERKDRMEFYADHNIGWVARPGDGHNGFKRRGKFKKVGIVLFHPALNRIPFYPNKYMYTNKRHH